MGTQSMIESAAARVEARQSFVILQLLEAIASVEDSGRRPILIEIGEKQARMLAAELGRWTRHFYTTHSDADAETGALWDSPPNLLTWEKVFLGPDPRTFCHIRIQGVESPDYLNVVAGS